MTKTSKPKVKPAPVQGSASEWYKSQIKKRIWMVLNYFSVTLSSVATFAFSALAEFALFKLVWFLLQGDIQQLPAVKTLAFFVQIGISVVSLVGMLIHVSFSLYGTFQTEIVFSKDE